MSTTVKIVLTGIFLTVVFSLTGCGGGTNYYGTYYQAYPEYGTRRVVVIREYRGGFQRSEIIGYPSRRPTAGRPKPTPRKHR